MAHTLSRVLGAAALAASLATAAPAGAAERALESRADTTPKYRLAEAASDQARLALAGRTPRRIYSEVVPKDGKLYLRGDVEAYARRSVVVQRRGCDSCKWRRFDVVDTGRRGWFRSTIRAPRHGSTFWRAKVRASNGYARSFSAIWETYH